VSDNNSNHPSLYENSEYPSRRRPPSAERPQRRRRRKKRRSVAGIIFKVLGTLLLVGVCTGAILGCFAAYYIKSVIVPIADLSLDDFPLGANSIMLYQDKATGQYKELVTLLNVTSSIWVDYEDMPEDLIHAAVAIEDQRFWTHPGVDWKRTAKAVLDMFTGGDISGGSTITQQLIKNTTGYNETTVKRKLTEIVRALRFTQKYSKEDTLERYLNIIPLGSGCEGVGSAAYEYFGKPVSELSLAECASLISITNNPSRYGPYSTARIATSTGEMWSARQWNKWRQENVLNAMLKQGMITQAEHDAAVKEELVFQRQENEREETTVYTWYEETVISDVRADLMSATGMSARQANQLLERGGLRIYTCLDPDIQAIADEIYTDRQYLNYTSKGGQDMQSSITVIDNATGNVAAIVGQFGDKTGNLWDNYANTAKRQPGSSIKPLSVYAPAFEMGKASPITVLDDYPYQLLNNRPWPLNAGFSSYRGRTTVRYGLTNSLNTIAVRTLADLVTPEASFNFMEEKFHIDLVDAREVNGEIKSDIGVAPLAMGGLTDGVCTRDMAEAYATFPNNGIYTKSRTYTKVTQLVNGSEVILLDNTAEPEPVLKDTTAYYINSVLQDVLTRGTAAGKALKGMHCAGKTGTTSDVYDLWFVGYTPYYTAAVWTGYPRNEEMGNGRQALDLWYEVMSRVHEGLEDKEFPQPGGLRKVSYCLDSGLLATEYCKMDPRGSRVASDYVFQESFPEGQYCNVHTEATVAEICVDDPIMDGDKDTGLCRLAGPYCPEASLRTICYPDILRESVGSASAADNRYRSSAVQDFGACTVHAEAPAQEPDPANPNAPTDPNAPWDPNSPSVDPIDPSAPGSSAGPGEPGASGNPGASGEPGASGGPGGEGTGGDIPDEPSVPVFDIRRD